MTIWQIQIEGNVRDLRFLAEVFATGPRKVFPNKRDPGYLYESDSFHSCATSQEVERLAEGEIAILSGILKLERGVRSVLKYGAVFRLNPTGGRDVFMSIHESLEVRVDIEAGTAVVTDAAGNVIAQPAPPPRSAVLFRIAASDTAIAKVFRLLSASDTMTWVGLYRIHEVIEDDVGGLHKLEKQGWVSANDLRRFKHSANSVQVGGDKSRHGKEPQVPPKNPMTLAGAEAYARVIVQAWLASKGA